MQGGMLILLMIPIAHHTERYRQSGKVGKDMVAAGEGVVPWGEVKSRVAANCIDPLYIVHFEYDFDKTDLSKTVQTELSIFQRLLTTCHET